MRKSRKNFNGSASKKSWVLSGEICLKRNKWDDDCAHPFMISFQAFSPRHAMKIGLERIKAFVRKEKEAADIKKFMLSSTVSMRSGPHAFLIRGQFRNNNILFVRRASLVFEKEIS